MSKNFNIKLPPLEINGLQLTLGLGGIHSVDKPEIFKADNDYVLLDADVTSFYPVSIIVNGICPEHLDKEIFKQLLVETIEDRKKYKKKKKDGIIYAALEYGLKISLNSCFGLFGYANFLLFDLLCTYQTTLNNQLFLLQLIEELGLANHKIISANTDGILLHVHKSELDSVRIIFKQWEESTGFNLEESEYDLYVRSSVNDYIARKTDGTIKIKGEFVPQGAYLPAYFPYDLPKSGDMYLPINGILKGFSFPVTALALQHYYLSNIDPEDFIYSHKDIFDFCTSQKVGSQFTNCTELVRRTIITNRPSTTKRIKVHEKVVVDAVYNEEIVTLKNGTTKTKRVKVSDKQTIPAVYEEITIEGNERVHPKINDEVIERTKQQKTIRMFVSRPTIEDDYLVGTIAKKVKIDDEGIERSSVYASGNFITLFNDYYDVKDFNDYNIDYQFYIDKVNKIINKIGKIV